MKGFKCDDVLRVLLTEGQNDCHVISHLCKLHQVPHNFGLYDCESDEKAIKKLRALIAGSDKKEVIGIVLDADNPSLAAKWDAVSDRLSKEGYKLPDQPNNKGTIITADKNPEENPKIGIWLMPDNNVNGMLEDFCRGLVGDSAMTFAEDCVKKAQDQGVSTFKNNHHSKAVIHTFLAWQDEPGMPLGQAITAHALDGNKPIAKDFVNFLSILFKE